MAPQFPSGNAPHCPPPERETRTEKGRFSSLSLTKSLLDKRRKLPASSSSSQGFSAIKREIPDACVRGGVPPSRGVGVAQVLAEQVTCVCSRAGTTNALWVMSLRPRQANGTRS